MSHDASISYSSMTGPFRAACVCGWILKPFTDEADAVRACWRHEREWLLADVAGERERCAKAAEKALQGSLGRDVADFIRRGDK